MAREIRGESPRKSRYDNPNNDTFGTRGHRSVRSDIGRSKYEVQERAHFDNDSRGGCLFVGGAILLASSLVLIGVSVDQAEAATVNVAATQTLSGPGWRVINPLQTTSLAPTTYRVEFDSTAARTKLTPYLKLSAARTQAQTPGVKFVVSTTIQKRVTSGCQKAGTIVVSLEYRPIAKKGYSWGGNCYRTTDHSLFAGVLRIDTEWFYSKWFSTNATTNTYKIRNAVTHEFGHAIGLDHPNRDLDHDGTVESLECPLNKDKTRPVMCAPNGGAVTSAGAGGYTALDTPGLKALTANYFIPWKA